MEAREGDSEKARQLFKKGTSADPKHAPVWQAWALMEAREGKVEKARQLFEKGTSADPKNAHLWQAWALMEAREGDAERARQIFERAQYLMPHGTSIPSDVSDAPDAGDGMESAGTAQAPEEAAPSIRDGLPDLALPEVPELQAPRVFVRQDHLKEPLRKAEDPRAWSDAELHRRIRELLAALPSPPSVLRTCPDQEPCVFGECIYRATSS